MAKKAIADARDAGLAFLRVAVTGFFPVNFGDQQKDLALWQTNPAQFWAAMDEMFDDLDKSGMRLVPTFVWNITQFPALGNDTVTTFIRNPQSQSRQLLARFIGDFITRYRSRNTIIFYELTNEMNLEADLDLSAKCKNAAGTACVFSSFTTSDMIAFSRELVVQFKSLSPGRPITSGYAIPRRSAAHLARHPQFATGGPDWTIDSPLEFGQYLLRVHEPFDIISVHIYPDKENSRFGHLQGHEYELVGDAAAVARDAGKPLFVGEFGDSFKVTPFTAGLLDQLVDNHVDYAAVWVWEFYQSAIYRTHDTEPTFSSIEPGYSDDLIALLESVQHALGGPVAPAPSGAPPRVILTWPLPCAVVDRPVELAAVASDGAKGVRSVEFLVDGRFIATDTAPPYYGHFDPTGISERTAQIEVRANGVAGESAAFKSTVKLNGAKPACEVGKTAP
ncbi:MAG: Ig-like domain-containing protein [Steroidobacteraceae bacterium]